MTVSTSGITTKTMCQIFVNIYNRFKKKRIRTQMLAFREKKISASGVAGWVSSLAENPPGNVFRVMS